MQETHATCHGPVEAEHDEALIHKLFQRSLKAFVAGLGKVWFTVFVLCSPADYSGIIRAPRHML